MAGRTFYDVLGVTRSATPDEIQVAYRNLARRWHPDVNDDPGAEDRFKEVSEAYDLLSDPATRRRYDAFGDGFRKVPEGTDPSRWHRAGRAAADFGFGAGGPHLDDLLGGIFGQRRAGGPRRGRDQHADLTLTVDDVIGGGLRSFDVGPAGSQRRISVRIPPGIVDGRRIRVRGEGGPGSAGGPPGDLLLTARIGSDDRYRVDGADLTVTLPVPMTIAALGGEAVVETPTGPTPVRVPAGSSSGRKLRLRGRGLPVDGGKSGDLYAVVAVTVPSHPTEHQRRLLEELAATETGEGAVADGDSEPVAGDD